ncbi:MAG TPA: hypothetical protein VHS96_08830, partial [Bacteroidia bacterium]|nr:hypothetical protein [Bacteroidia bacterium]
IATLSDLLTPFEDKFDLTLPIAQIKAEILAHHRDYIIRYQHPSVWKTIKDIHTQSPKWTKIFADLPMALDW